MFNMVFMLGYMGKDPEMRTSEKGTPYCVVSIATNYLVKKTGTDDVCWFRTNTYGGLGKILFERGRKGGLIFAFGRMRQQSWQHAEGHLVNDYDVIIDFMRLLN